MQEEADQACHRLEWSETTDPQRESFSFQRVRSELLVSHCTPFSPYFRRTSCVRKNLVFTAMTSSQSTVYTHATHTLSSMPETVEHRLLRSKKVKLNSKEQIAVKIEPGTPMSPSKLSPRSPISSPTKVIIQPEFIV